MAYARWNCDGSDVYVYETDAAYVCEDCCEQPTPRAMVAHLFAHRRKGDSVPGEAVDRLLNEAHAGHRPGKGCKCRNCRRGEELATELGARLRAQALAQLAADRVISAPSANPSD